MNYMGSILVPMLLLLNSSNVLWSNFIKFNRITTRERVHANAYLYDGIQEADGVVNDHGLQARHNTIGNRAACHVGRIIIHVCGVGNGISKELQYDGIFSESFGDKLLKNNIRNVTIKSIGRYFGFTIGETVANGIHLERINAGSQKWLSCVCCDTVRDLKYIETLPGKMPDDFINMEPGNIIVGQPRTAKNHIVEYGHLVAGIAGIGNGVWRTAKYALLAICPNENVPRGSYIGDGCPVRDSLAKTDSTEGYHIKYYKFQSTHGHPFIADLDSIHYVYYAKMIDLDVSADGKKWYHLMGDLPCANKYPRLFPISAPNLND